MSNVSEIKYNKIRKLKIKRIRRLKIYSEL